MSTAQDRDFFRLTTSISKALNPIEAPLKAKHARATIIGTHKTQGGQTFWAIVQRQPLMENRFTAWKFCHLLHRVLREGHPQCIKQSQRHKKMMIEVGKLWGHLKDGLGICIQHYTKLLVVKLDFHDRNPLFPGTLILEFSDLERASGDDINYYFQLGVEMFDYLDEIIALQRQIFTAIDTFRMSSMTPQGQCRLAPLVPLIQDSNPLYDYAVRLMFKLHSHLPNDILCGHRERFRIIFNQLKDFYDHVRRLQYFADLIQVPKLPENAPNFSSSVDFGSYIPPVVIVPEPEASEPDPFVDNLIDISQNNHHNNQEQNHSMASTPEPLISPTNQSQLQQSPPPQQPTSVNINFEKILQDRDNLIRELQIEIERLGKILKSMTIQHRDEIKELEEQIERLNIKLTGTETELEQMKLKNDELEMKAQTAPTLEQKVSTEAERAKASEEKFQKLMALYTKIRNEHVDLLRTHGEVTKQLSSIKLDKEDLTTEKELLKVQLEEYQQKQAEQLTVIEQTNETKRREKELNEKHQKIVQEYEKLKSTYDNLVASNLAEIAELKSELDATQLDKESMKSEQGKLIVQLKTELENRQQELMKSEESCKILIVQRDSEIEELKNKLREDEEKFKTINANMERLSNEKFAFENEIHDVLHQQAEIEEKHNSALQTISALESSLRDTTIRSETSLRALLEACLKSSEKLAMRAMNENEFTNAVGTSAYFMMLAEELQDNLNELKIVYEKYSKDNTLVEGLARKTVLSGHLMATVQIQGMTICNTSADIECGEKIGSEIKAFCKDVTNLFDSLHQNPPSTTLVSSRIDNVKEKLTQITTMIHDLSSKLAKSDQISDQLDSELAAMDKAIDEAASKIADMLTKSKASDSGLKLEVNEKILDACTHLMKCIRMLVQKSRLLQGEIVAVGKGTASAKEFYKRNHQWTEGLISAAKSVAQGANLLVTASNKAVSGDSKHHLDLVVAAQEIAASTAQLVVASRVKAPRGSQNLSALSSASRDVTQATGAVVATAKNCSQQLEDSQDLDLTKLTVHQAKTLEMEIQVKVLELEQALSVERLKLAAFRRKNYQNSD
ncbi:huntingtin-interacting protein 1 isoform X2 [Condylostylus longicornis]|uniref:huntingtin-interacting protein 1 isoform X2 n=1 Tax=Condylostylus longicornis TaxID=2530218 RepID=UPI00244E315B|nr:huntingtin-interacting protein 1 isoform X2 [Condylostylus longicornis]XP_055383765.1 huntingtin-interacting protein 1 isoform X2 [Condylostylus longicornis]XP_055383766.1 huntingtin-interacting protein 1 isoform X2 [Condylostylus longicornis]